MKPVFRKLRLILFNHYPKLSSNQYQTDGSKFPFVVFFQEERFLLRPLIFYSFVALSSDRFIILEPLNGKHPVLLY